MVPLCNNQNSIMLTLQGRTYVLRPPTHHNDVMKTLNEQRKKGDKNLCDVTLEVERTVMLAHKAVLASCSSYFKDRFEEKKVRRTSTDLDRLQKQASVAMSPPASPPIKRRRNALSECLPETSSSPVPPYSTSTPPPQSLQSRLRPTSSKPLLNFSGEVVVLPGLKLKAFSLILDYMYTSELQINKENVQDLLLVSCLLQIKTIVDACVKILTKENKWKLSNSNFRFNKKSPFTSAKVTSSIPNYSTANRSIQSDSLLASPLRSLNSSHDRSAKNNSHKTLRSVIEVTSDFKESTNRLVDSTEKKACVAPAQQRPRDCIDDVIQLENQARSDSCKKIATGRTISNNASTSQSILRSVNGQLCTLPKANFNECLRAGLTKEKDKFLESLSKSEFRGFTAKNDTNFRRNRTVSDSSYSTHDNEEALDLRSKWKQNLSDDETRKSSHQVAEKSNLYHRNNLTLSKQVKNTFEIKSARNDETLTSCSEPIQGKTTLTQGFSVSRTKYAPEADLLERRTDSEKQQHAMTSLDISESSHIRPSCPSLTPAFASRHFVKDFGQISQRLPISSDALKHVGFFTNIPAQLSNFVWKDPTKPLVLDGISALRERQPLNAFEALQICAWPNYFERHSVQHTPESLHPQAPSNFSMKTSSNIVNFDDKILSLTPDGGSELCRKITSFSSDKSAKQPAPQQQAAASYEPNKHPLKRKLMMSAAIENSDSFRANSIDEEPPTKSSPKPASPIMSRFEPLRGPESVGPTTRPQQCVI